jgi:hypothetical protein
MRRAQHGDQYLSDECLEACRFKLTAVLARLTTGHLHEDINAVGRIARSPVSESTTELALCCRKYLPGNRMQWTSFLTRQAAEALERIEDGSYGFCRQCGQPISPKRLAALPWAALCTGCQEKRP